MITRYETAAHITAKRTLSLDDPLDWRRALRQFAPGAVVTVRIDTRREPRTRGQLGYYWGVLLPQLAAATGHDPDDLHSFFKLQFNPLTLTLGGTRHTVGGSTRTLTPRQFSDYLDRIQRWAETDLRVFVTAPDRSGGAHDDHADDPAGDHPARDSRARLEPVPQRRSSRRRAHPRPPQ